MFTYILLALVVYFLYKFVFGFVVPVLRASRKMREKMREMQGNMPGFSPAEEETNNRNTGFTSRNNASSKPSSRDYIEFEEIK